MTTRAQRRRQNLDMSPLWAGVLLMLIGVGVIYSALLSPGGVVTGDEHLKQLQWVVVALLVAGFATLISPRTLDALTWPLYGLILLGLVAVLVLPADMTGTHRWLRIGAFTFQPSELAKVFTLLGLARYLGEHRCDPNRVGTILQVFAIAGLPMLLVLKQPDLGTSLVFPPLAVALLYWRGLSTVNLFLLVTPAISAVTAFIYPPVLGEPDFIHMLPWATLMILVTGAAIFSGMGVVRGVFALATNIGAGIVTPYIWRGLKSYQQQRIVTFLQPEADPLGAGYQIIQSKVAIGSGGFWGKGYLNGSQSKLDFLPERHTDFVFAVLGEEAGWVGAVFVLLVFFFVVARAIQIARQTRHRYASLVAFGIATIFCFHVLVNVGMATGLMPVTGLTLPLVSYGGSSMVVTMGMIGLLVGIGMRRHHQ